MESQNSRNRNLRDNVRRTVTERLICGDPMNEEYIRKSVEALLLTEEVLDELVPFPEKKKKEEEDYYGD